MRRAAGDLIDRALLRDATRRVDGRPPEVREMVRELVRAARVRRTAARELADPDLEPAAATLLRDAGVLYLRALATLRAEPEATVGPADWTHIDALAGPDAPPRPAGFEEALRVLAETDLLALGGMTLGATRPSVDATLDWMERTIEPRTTGELLRTRRIRLAAVIGLPTLVVAALLLPRAENLAESARVTASAGSGSSPSLVVVTDGVLEQAPFETAKTDRPWLTLDLDSEHELRRVEITAGVDGPRIRHPLTVELSNDGKEWTEVVKTRSDIKDGQTWVWGVPNRRARYVRIRSQRRRESLAIAEVRVF